MSPFLLINKPLFWAAQPYTFGSRECKSYTWWINGIWI